MFNSPFHAWSQTEVEIDCDVVDQRVEGLRTFEAKFALRDDVVVEALRVEKMQGDR